MCIRDVRYAINIPAFIEEVKEGNFAEAYQDHQHSPLHFLQSVAVYVHRRASVKENVSVVSKVNRYAIGKLERFVADWARENGIKPEAPAEKNGQ